MKARIGVALAALLALAAALWQLEQARSGLEIRTFALGSIPVTVFRSSTAKPAPAVVVGHGFAGSQQLMQPFAVALAQAGYVAVTFDQPGHADNPAAMPGDFLESDARDGQLLTALDAVLAAAKPLGDGRVALLGHSMAAQVVLRYASEHPEIAATVAVSPFAADHVNAVLPRNLLVVDGALEPEVVRNAAAAAVRIAAGEGALPATTYGDFGRGTARRYAYAGGVEHIGVLYSEQSRAEAVAWFNQAFGRAGPVPALPDIGLWLGVLYAGLVALAWPLAALLPRIRPVPTPVGPASPGARRRQWAAMVLPAVATPLLLWKLPLSVLPIMLADYLLLHFALYGLLTLLLCRVLGVGAPVGAPTGATKRPVAPTGAPTAARAVIAIILVSLYAIFAFGLPTDRYATAFMPGPGRGIYIGVLFIGTLLWFCADELLTRSPGLPRWAYAVTKLCFVASLLLAVALNPYRLFFLVIIVPAMALFFLVYGLMSRWVFRRTGEPLVAAVANAAVFAWAIGVSFPLAG